MQISSTISPPHRLWKRLNKSADLRVLLLRRQRLIFGDRRKFCVGSFGLKSDDQVVKFFVCRFAYLWREFRDGFSVRLFGLRLMSGEILFELSVFRLQNQQS